jgi:hypothetical protein
MFSVSYGNESTTARHADSPAAVKPLDQTALEHGSFAALVNRVNSLMDTFLPRLTEFRVKPSTLRKKWSNRPQRRTFIK